MKVRIAALASVAIALVALTGCAGGSAEDRAKETAVSYMNVNLGYDTETDVASFACEGTELSVFPNGMTEAPVTAGAASAKEDGTWMVPVSFTASDGSTPTSDIIVSAGGDCIVKGR